MTQADSVESAAPYPIYLDWLRYLSAFLLFPYASSKLLGRQFSLPPEIALRPVGSLSGYRLAWFYYGHSHVYAVILGLIQFAGGALLVSRKTALLGRGPDVAGDDQHPGDQRVFSHRLGRDGHVGIYLFIFLSLLPWLAVLWHQRRALMGVFWTDQAGEPASVRRHHRTIAALVVLLVITLMGLGLWLSAPQIDEFGMPAPASGEAWNDPSYGAADRTRTCPNSLLIRAKKAAIVWAAPKGEMSHEAL